MGIVGAFHVSNGLIVALGARAILCGRLDFVMAVAAASIMFLSVLMLTIKQKFPVPVIPLSGDARSRL
jgi:hypothetical protein